MMGMMQCQEAVGEVINIGGTEEISISDLAQRIITITEFGSCIQHISYDQAFGKDFEDMQRRVPGIDKARQFIGFEPQTSLDDIIRSVVRYCREAAINSRELAQTNRCRRMETRSLWKGYSDRET